MATQIDLEAWVWAERPYWPNGHRGTDTTDEVRVCGRGGAPLIFTAPHSISHVRGGRGKRSEAGTGGLAELLADRCGGLAVTALGRQSGDPNWDPAPGEFKRTLLGRLRPGVLVVDLHGMSDAWEEDVIVGLGAHPTGASRVFADGLLAALAAQGLRARQGRPFHGRGRHTITTSVQALGISGLQVEIAARRRRPMRAPEQARPFLAAMLGTVTRV